MGGGFFTHSRGELLRPDTRLGAEAGNGLDQLKSTRFALQGPHLDGTEKTMGNRLAQPMGCATVKLATSQLRSLGGIWGQKIGFVACGCSK